MFIVVYYANQLKLKHEEITGKYYLVIRTRPDLSLNQDINLPELKKFIDQHNNLIVSPRNHRHGQGPTNDQFAIGLSKSIDLYSEVANNLDEIYNSGVEYGPETLLYHHLKRSGIIDYIGKFEGNLREHYYIENNRHIVDLGTWG